MPDVDFSDAAQNGLTFSTSEPAAPKLDFSDAAKYGLSFSVKEPAIASAPKLDFSDAAQSGVSFTADNGTPDVPTPPGLATFRGGFRSTVSNDLRGYTRQELAQPSGQFNYRTGQQYTLGQQLERVPILDAPITGAQEITAGVEQMAQPDAGEKGRAVLHLARGAFDVATPALGVATTAAPLDALGWLYISHGLKLGSKDAALAAGASPQDAELISDTVSNAPLAVAGVRKLWSDFAASRAQIAQEAAENWQSMGDELEPARAQGGGSADPIPVTLKSPNGAMPGQIEFAGVMADGRPILKVTAEGRNLIAGTASDLTDWLSQRAADPSFLARWQQSAQNNGFGESAPLAAEVKPQADLVREQQTFAEPSSPQAPALTPDSFMAEVSRATAAAPENSDIPPSGPVAMAESPAAQPGEGFVQRVEEPGVGRADFSKPHGIYTSPAEVESPHADLGGETYYWQKNPAANVLTFDSTPDDEDVVIRRGAISAGAGVHAARELLGAAEFNRLKATDTGELRGELEGQYPEIDWSRYYDKQELLEGLGGILARTAGYDAIALNDRQDPRFSEYVGLTPRSMWPVAQPGSQPVNGTATSGQNVTAPGAMAESAAPVGETNANPTPVVETQPAPAFTQPSALTPDSFMAGQQAESPLEVKPGDVVAYRSDPSIQVRVSRVANGKLYGSTSEAGDSRQAIYLGKLSDFVPAEAAEPASNEARPAAAYGQPTSIPVPGEETVYPAQYALREIRAIAPSHGGLSFEPNPDYDYQNDRDYAKPANGERVVRQAANFEPAYLLSDNPDAVNGPPIVDARGNVLGGNSRAMTLQRVYATRPEAAENYRQQLEAKAVQFGLDPAQVSQMDRPVLVREVSALANPQQAITDFNKTGTAALTSSERALADSRRVSSDTLEYLGQQLAGEGDDATLAQVLGSTKGPQIINRLVEDGVITPQEKPAYIDERGIVTPEGKQRITRLTVGRLFDSPAAYENAAPELRNKLERVVGPLARVGDDPEWSLTDQTREAVRMLTEARQRGIKNLDDLASQSNMFGVSEYSPEALSLAKTLQQGPRKLASAFQQYAGDSALARSGPTLGFVEPPTPGQSFAAAFEAADGEVPRGRMMRPFADVPFDEEHATVREAIDKARAIYRPGRGGYSGILYVNPAAREVLAQLGRASQVQDWGNLSLNRAAARQVIGRLDRGMLRFAGRGAQRIFAIRQELKKALAGDGNVIIIEAGAGRTLHEVKAAIRHESHHRHEVDYSPEQAKVFLEDPIAHAAGRTLVERGYPDDPVELTSEIASHLAEDHTGAALGLTPEQAEVLWRRYVRQYPGIFRFERMHPRLRKAANEELAAQGESPDVGQPGTPPEGRGRGGRGSLRPGVQADAGRLSPAGRETPPDRGGRVSPLEQSAAAERDRDREPSLFDSATNDEVASTAARDRDQLEGSRLTAQLNSPLTREEQLKKLKASKEEPQSNLFEDNSPAQGSLFLGSGLGAMQPYVERFLKQDVMPTAKQAAEVLSLAKDDVLKILAPAARGSEAQAAALSVRENAAEIARSMDRAQAALAVAKKYFDAQPDQANYDFMDRVENGLKQSTPELDKFAAVMREVLDTRRAAIQALGTRKLERFIENYFPHIWKQTAQAREVFSKRPLEGPKSFLKQRSLPTIADGLAAGLEPISTNPVELVLMKAREMDKYLAAHRILGDLKEQGLLKFVDAREGEVPAGWQKIDDPVATVYGPSVQAITEYPNEGAWNALERVGQALGISHSRGFLNLRGALGRASRAGEIRTLHATAEDVVAHEIGHQIDWLAGSGKRFILEYPDAQSVATLKQARKTLKDKSSTLDERRAARKTLDSMHGVIQQRKKFSAELRALADLRSGKPEYTHKREEKMAQLAEMWVGARQQFARTAPTVFALWKQFLDENPKLHALRDIEGSTEVKPLTHNYDVGGLVIKGHWWAPEPAARVLNHYLSPGLRDKSGLFRAYLGAANLLNQAQLGFSAFHLAFTSMDVATSKLALGIYQMGHGDILKGLKSTAQTATAPFTTIVRGDKMLKEWYAPGTQGARIGELVDAAVRAGGRAHMDSFYETQISKRLMEAFRAGNVLGALFRVPGAVMEQAARPIMEYIVPRQKMGVFADLAQYELERLGPNADAQQVQGALARAWDSVDNRLGQLVYDNLFWHKVVKDLAMASVRSVGWNLGTIRELAGGLADSAKFAGGKGDFTPRMSYLLALPIIAGLLGAIAYYLWHGHAPKHLKDYYFPTDARGHRWSLPTYMKDVYHYGTDPLGTLKGKIHPLASLIWDMLSNKDFFDKPVRNPHHSLVKQAEELASFAAKQVVPFSARGNQQKGAHRQSVQDRVLPFFGITPAPKSLDHARR